MKHVSNIQIAFLYNIRHIYPDPDDPHSHTQADFDDKETIDEMVKHLKNVVKRVIPVEANREAYIKLKRHQKEIDLVFNYSLGLYGRDRYAHIPAMCEMLELPYTGSSPLSQALINNKHKAKDMLKAYDVPTLPYRLFRTNNGDLKLPFDFPALFKPAAQGSSAGITNKSVVRNEATLKRQIDFIHKTFNQPALVEPFLTGREFSVPMLGNPPKFLPIIEADHSDLPKGYEPLDSLEVKWVFEEEASGADHLVCPAKMDKKLQRKIESMCLKAWQACNLKDWCRIDVRCDEKDNPYILEINSPPGMIPPAVSMTSYFPLAARRSKIEYEDLLKTVFKTTLERYTTNLSHQP